VLQIFHTLADRPLLIGGVRGYFENRATSAASCIVDEFACATRRMASLDCPFCIASFNFVKVSLIALKREASSFDAMFMI
jgi:hypothetical protein